MAYLYKDNLFLIRENITSKVLRFSSNSSNKSLVATVGLYPVTLFTNGFQNITNSNYVCPNTKYFIRVSFPEWPDNRLAFLTPLPNTDDYTYTEVVSTYNSFMSIQVNDGPIVANTPFEGVFTANTKPSLRALFTIEPNEYYYKVGYTARLPRLLSNCNNCPCSPGSTCNRQGICIQSGPIIEPCRSTGICGANGGKCFGRCANGGLCKLQGGKYTCVPNKMPWWLILIWIILAIILATVVSLFFWSILRPPKVTTTTTTTTKQIPMSEQQLKQIQQQQIQQQVNPLSYNPNLVNPQNLANPQAYNQLIGQPSRVAATLPQTIPQNEIISFSTS